jgi:hypothetical protein
MTAFDGAATSSENQIRPDTRNSCGVSFNIPLAAHRFAFGCPTLSQNTAVPIDVRGSTLHRFRRCAESGAFLDRLSNLRKFDGPAFACFQVHKSRIWFGASATISCPRPNLSAVAI